jgi:hypothetical protein
MKFLKQLRTNPDARRVGLPVYRGYSIIKSLFSREPPVLADSMPKAGTHLLTVLLGSLPRCIHSGYHFELDQFERPYPWAYTGNYDWEMLRCSLAAIRSGQYLTGHFPKHDHVRQALSQLGFRHIFIIRDPRDVVVSAVHYRMARRDHPLHQLYVNMFESMEERLLATIEGFPSQPDQRGWLPIESELERYIGWKDADDTYFCHFEDLIGSKGSGQDERQFHEVSQIACFADRTLSDAQIKKVAAKIWSPQTSTCRKGTLGQWQDYFKNEHREVFKRRAGHLLTKLGYEYDNNW